MEHFEKSWLSQIINRILISQPTFNNVGRKVMGKPNI